MIVSIDADLQDDVSVIEEMVDKYHDGYEVVYGVRNNRDTDSAAKRMSAEAFYKLMKWLGSNTINNHADFRLMSRRAVETLVAMPEVNIYLRGMVPLVGFANTNVYYKRAERLEGESKYPIGKMIGLALEGITSFSVRPLRLIFHVGLIAVLISIVLIIKTLVDKLSGVTDPGWTSMMISIWFIGGVQMLCLSIVSEYIGKIFSEVKRRPRFIIEKNLLKDK
jgi:hypothetical protein